MSGKEKEIERRTARKEGDYVQKQEEQKGRELGRAKKEEITKSE